MGTPQDVLRKQALQTTHHDAAVRAAVAPVPGGVRMRLLTFPIGTRVLDTITGEQGTVVNGKRENVIIPPA